MGTYSGGETLYSIEREDLNGNIVPTLEAIFSYVYEFGDNGLKGGLKLKTIPQTKLYSHLQTTIAGLTITYKYYPKYNKFIQIGIIKEIK